MKTSANVGGNFIIIMMIIVRDTFSSYLNPSRAYSWSNCLELNSCTFALWAMMYLFDFSLSTRLFSDLSASRSVGRSTTDLKRRVRDGSRVLFALLVSFESLGTALDVYSMKIMNATITVRHVTTTIFFALKSMIINFRCVELTLLFLAM